MSVAYEVSPVSSAADYLGPATVVEMRGATPLVDVLGERVRAELAFTFPYEPVVDDVLLVIAKDEAYYAIGLLHARGQVALRFEGDVRISAINGKLELEGDHGVRVRGRSVEVVTERLSTVADRIVERANNVYRRVRESLDMHAGSKRELVDKDISTRAETVHTTTSGVVTINGKGVHLG